MTTRPAYTPLQKQLLALLEEAGEEDLLTLVNTVANCKASSDVVSKVRDALIELIKLETAEISIGHSESGQWTSLPKDAGHEALSNAARCVKWSPDEHQWRWLSTISPIWVVLTEKGQREAHHLLDREGWLIRGAD